VSRRDGYDRLRVRTSWSRHDCSGSPAVEVCAIAATERSGLDTAGNSVNVEREVRRLICTIRSALQSALMQSFFVGIVLADLLQRLDQRWQVFRRSWAAEEVALHFGAAFFP
jgi:hypothetical protein